MTESSFRAVAVLKAREGREQELLDFTSAAAREIRKVDGLHKLEVSRSLADPGQLVLYYWWESPAYSQRYVAGPVYADIGPRLQNLVQDHLLVVSKLVSDS